MKNTIIFAVLFAVITSSCNDEVKLTGRTITVNYPQTENYFSGVAVQDGIRLIYKQGDSESVSAVMDEALEPYFRHEHKQRILFFRFDKAAELPTNHNVTVTVSSVDVSSLTGDGSTITVNDAVKSGRMTVTLLNGASLTGGVFECPYMTINMNQNSQAVFDGTVRNFSAGMTNGCDLKAFDLNADSVSVGIHNGCSAEVTANMLLNVKASSGSKLTYKGSPELGELEFDDSEIVKF